MAKRERTPAKASLAFNHAMIYVRDVERSLRFYRDLLGLRLIETFEHGGHAVYARLRSPGGGTIALHLLGEGVTVAQSGGIRLYFEARGLNALCKELAARGVQFKQMPKRMPWGWDHAYLNDPDGYEVSLYWAGKKRLQKSRM
jgi:catechol 2,3-dioxygenase-like lactoylglutathione lyase family enzyme